MIDLRRSRVIFIFVVKEFLLLEEIAKNSSSPPQEEKNPSVEIQNMTCYWDKVRFTQSVFTAQLK